MIDGATSMRAARARRIMLVDDADDICDSLAELFADEGYAVTRAENGRVALSRLRELADGELPDLILLDLMMPEMDGYEFCAVCRADSRIGRIPVLLMTAGGDVENTALKLGARGYLKKPFKDIGTILDTVESAFAASS